LDLFKSDRLLEKLKPKIAFLSESLSECAQLEHVGNIRQCGLAAGIELVEDKATKRAYPWEQKVGIRVCLEARKHGIFSRPLGNTVVVFPPLTITRDELELLMYGLEQAIRQVTGV
jgi:adenosylmethionine-8-amino-7-oxononanoate aminotransferase